MKAGGVGNDRFGFAAIEVDHVFSAPEGDKFETGGVFHHADQVTWETAQLKKLKSQFPVSQVYNICEFAFGQVRQRPHQSWV
jgi:hypothetical protein